MKKELNIFNIEKCKVRGKVEKALSKYLKGYHQKKVKTYNPLFHKEEEHAMRDICYKKADSSWMLENNDLIIKPFELPITQRNNVFFFTRCVQVEASGSVLIWISTLNRNNWLLPTV